MRPRFCNPFGLVPFGGDSGINTQGDVLVNVTADGVDVNRLWDEVAQVLSAWNSERTAIAQCLSHPTINAAEAVPQSVSDDSFEEASEFGVPQSLRAPSNAILLGNTLVDYDKASRFSWRFLRDSTAEQVRAVTNYALAADNKLTNGLVLRRIFDPAVDSNEFNHACMGMWCADGAIPPPHLGRVFQGDHSHYLISGAETIDSGDLESAIVHVTEHGYGVDAGSQLLAFMNPAEAECVAAFRAGVESADNIVARHDYIPSTGAPAWLSPENIIGRIAPAQFNGLKINGSYGPVWIIESQYIPAGYFCVVATGGANSPLNPISVRSHTNPTYQGLRVIPGPVPNFPIQESYLARTIGVGTRHRGAAVVMQIKESGDYEAPDIAI